LILTDGNAEKVKQGGSVKTYNVVGPQIRRLRYNLGWSQEKLAGELRSNGLEVGREFVAKIEGQTHRVDDRYLPYFATCLKVPVNDLFPRFPQNLSLRERISLFREKTPNGGALSIVPASLQSIMGNESKV
jgi:transcriptional regulator with XRE-family HTH domain